MQNLTFRFMKTAFLGLALLGCATACYKMPTDDDYSSIPTTNNPQVTRDKGGWTPSVKY